MIPSGNGNGGNGTYVNMGMYRKKNEPIIIKTNDYLQYDVPASDIDTAKEVINKEYADTNLVPKSMITTDSNANDDVTIPTSKAVNEKVLDAALGLLSKVDTKDGSASRLSVTTDGANATNALSIKGYGSSKGWGISTTPANDTACQLWRFNNSTGTYRASMSQAGQNVTIDDFLRISLTGFGSSIETALITKPANATDCSVWILKNSAGSSIASIWQSGDVARLVGFSSNLLKFINYGTALSEAITFTPTALSGAGVATMRFNDTTGTVKSTISQRADGAIRITGSNGMDMIGYTGTASGLSCTPGETGITYPIKFQSTTAAIQGFVYQAGNEVTYNGTKAEFYGYTKEALITKPSVTTDHVLWSLRNSANTQVATISQSGDVPYLTGFTSRKLKITGYPGVDTEGLSFTPTSATANNAVVFNNNSGTQKGSIFQTADGSVRHFCQTIDLTGFTNAQGPAINIVPGNTTGNYAMSIKNNAGTYIGGIWQDGDVVTFETTKIKLKTDTSAVDSFATTLNTSTTAIPRCSAVSTALASYAPLAGATFTSQVNVPTLKLTGSSSAITAINTSIAATPSNSSLLTESGIDTFVRGYTANFVSDSGDTMTGQLVLPSMKLNGTVVDSVSSTLNTSASSIPTCSAVSDALAAANSGYLPLSGGTLTRIDDSVVRNGLTLSGFGKTIDEVPLTISTPAGFFKTVFTRFVKNGVERGCIYDSNNNGANEGGLVFSAYVTSTNFQIFPTSSSSTIPPTTWANQDCELQISCRVTGVLNGVGYNCFTFFTKPSYSYLIKAEGITMRTDGTLTNSHMIRNMYVNTDASNNITSGYCDNVRGSAISTAFATPYIYATDQTNKLVRLGYSGSGNVSTCIYHWTIIPCSGV